MNINGHRQRRNHRLRPTRLEEAIQVFRVLLGGEIRLARLRVHVPSCELLGPLRLRNASEGTILLLAEAGANGRRERCEILGTVGKRVEDHLVVKAGNRLLQLDAVLGERHGRVLREVLGHLGDLAQRVLQRAPTVHVLLGGLQTDLRKTLQVVAAAQNAHKLQLVAVPRLDANFRAAEHIFQGDRQTVSRNVHLREDARTAITDRVAVLADHGIDNARSTEIGHFGICLVRGNQIRDSPRDQHLNECLHHIRSNRDSLLELCSGFQKLTLRNQSLPFIQMRLPLSRPSVPNSKSALLSSRVLPFLSGKVAAINHKERRHPIGEEHVDQLFADAEILGRGLSQTQLIGTTIGPFVEPTRSGDPPPLTSTSRRLPRFFLAMPVHGSASSQALEIETDL